MKLYTLTEVSEILDVSEPTVKALIERGQLSASNVGLGSHKVYRVEPNDLTEFIQNRKIKQVQSAPVINKQKHIFAR